MFSVRSATFAAHRVPSHAVPSPRAAGAPLQLGAAIPGSQHRHLPEGSPAHTPHSSHRADSPGCTSPPSYCCTIGPAA